MLLQNTAIVAKKLLVDEKITACVKQICLQGVVCKVSKIKTLSGERFGFVKKRLLHQHLNVVLRGKIVFFYCCPCLRAANWPQPTLSE